MMIIARTLLAIGVVIALTSVSYAESPGSSDSVTPSFESLPASCIRSIPDNLRSTLNNELSVRASKTPISPDLKRTLKDTIAAHDEGKPSDNAERRRAITEVGTNSIPVIAEMLLSQDERTRGNAVLALSYLQPLPNSGVTETPGDQNLRIMLLRVGILDMSSTVRRSAIRYLARIGYANPRNIPEGVLAGIIAAMDDPDPRLKRIAETEKEALEIAAEAAQTRSEEPSDTTGVSVPPQAGGK